MCRGCNNDSYNNMANKSLLSTSQARSSDQVRGWLRSSIEWGADEAVGDTPRNYFAAPKVEVLAQPVPQAAPQNTPLAAPVLKMHASPALATGSARELADKVATMAELEAAIRAFDGCALKKTAQKTVFGDGDPQAKLMIIGEAPGADEDRQGIPFCGVSGQLLDKMFASIGYDRTRFFISNTVYWRPPGNRQPSIEETSICLPFVEKMIALVNPKLLVLAGGTAVGSLLQRPESMSRLRGKTYDYTNGYLAQPIPTIVTYHPSYLLRSPAQKRLAWQDMLMVKRMLEN